MRKLLWIAALLAAGCSQRDAARTVKPAERAQSAEERAKLYTAAERSVQLRGMTTDQVESTLGPPSDTYSNFWRYDSVAWNPRTRKRCALYVRFDLDARVASCD